MQTFRATTCKSMIQSFRIKVIIKEFPHVLILTDY
jgi:hypothetical protein